MLLLQVFMSTIGTLFTRNSRDKTIYSNEIDFNLCHKWMMQCKTIYWLREFILSSLELVKMNVVLQ